MTEDDNETDEYEGGKGPTNRKTTPASTANTEYDPRDRNVDTEQQSLASLPTQTPEDASSETVTETPDEEQDRPLADIYYESNLTPDAPDAANIDRAERFVSLGDVEDIEEGGANKGSTYIGHTPEGDTMFVKENADPSTMSGHENAHIVKQALDTDQLDEGHVPEIPDTTVDFERQAVSAEDVGGEDTEIPIFHDFENGPVSKDSYLNAWAFKAVSADWDIGGNIIGKWDDERGEDGAYVFSPVDFDFNGDTNLPDDADLDDVIRHIRDLGLGVKRDVDITEAEAKERMKEFADAIDVGVLEERLEQARERETDHKTKSSFDNRLENRLENTIKMVETIRDPE